MTSSLTRVMDWIDSLPNKKMAIKIRKCHSIHYPLSIIIKSTKNTNMNMETDDGYEVLYSDVSLSFWGGIDPITGIVIDHSHPLQGQCVSGKVLW